MAYGALFDMDGILIDSATAHLQAWRRLGVELKREFSEELFESTFGEHNMEIIPKWIEGLSATEIDDLSRRKEGYFREVATDEVRPIDGAVELIHDLHGAGVQLAVGSSGPTPNVELALEILGVRPLFRALSTGDDVQNGKPHPEVFLTAASRLELSPQRCVVLEDAPQGVAAGCAAGARVIGVTTSRPAADLAAADLVVDSMRDLSAAKLVTLIDAA